ncbi:hypothetical protein SSX86_016509 [Deinandra increscens subsp. villosa]|uniref:Uncharacterized protein n=1 Tax=Deinandra increscens subsp. villosa TaxID=3103831 RepID=A0AAP0CY42_9ASTR
MYAPLSLRFPFFIPQALISQSSTLSDIWGGAASGFSYNRRPMGTSAPVSTSLQSSLVDINTLGTSVSVSELQALENLLHPDSFSGINNLYKTESFWRQLRDQTNVTDIIARLRVQSNALRSHALLLNLGAFLLELGRTTMTLRMGFSQTDVVVNARPAPTAGPNPIMVQAPTPNFSLGTSLRPRNIDIRIKTGSVLSSAVNHREATGEERSAIELAASDGGISNQQAALGNLPQTGGGLDVHVVPIRISTLPPGSGLLSDQTELIFLGSCHMICSFLMNSH